MTFFSLILVLASTQTGCGHVREANHPDLADAAEPQDSSVDRPDAQTEDSGPDAQAEDAGGPVEDACDFPAFDGDPCAEGLCRDGNCDSSSCFIEGEWYRDGDPGPDPDCTFCDVEAARTEWTPLSDEAPCEDGLCWQGECCTGCWTGATCHAWGGDGDGCGSGGATCLFNECGGCQILWADPGTSCDGPSGPCPRGVVTCSGTESIGCSCESDTCDCPPDA